jgi:hypothetical protein
MRNAKDNQYCEPVARPEYVANFLKRAVFTLSVKFRQISLVCQSKRNCWAYRLQYPS